MVLLVTNKGKECTRSWKKPNPAARPSAQVTMKTASQRFSTRTGLNLFKLFFQNGSHTYGGLGASAERVNVWSLLYILGGLNQYCFYSKHSTDVYAALVAAAYTSKTQLLHVCWWYWLFSELKWNRSIRSKATRSKSVIMLLAHHKQIIQNQRNSEEQLLPMECVDGRAVANFFLWTPPTPQ